ncbi:MAG: PstS family phosphate ABC transporter substrate-binding protein [Mycoplasmoidaceae bacterium]
MKIKLSKKSILKSIMILMSTTIVFIPIVVFSSIKYSFPLVTAAGSSTVYPLMKSFSEKFSKFDLTVQAGGSGVGIQSILGNKKDIGMASKDPYPQILDSKNNNIKTITIAWDGIGIIYKSKSDLNFNSKNVLENIYRVFAGKKAYSYHDIDPLMSDNTIIHPYARTGGAGASGTADAFLNDNHLLLPPEQKKINDELNNELVNGNYGSYTSQTAESNSQTWQQVSTDRNDGVITYLSAGYIINNEQEIKNKGFKIAQYQGYPMNEKNITRGYNWYRPLNMMISLKNNNFSVLKEFIYWYYYPTAKDIISKEGFINLSQPQINSMQLWESQWEGDINLKHSGALTNPLPKEEL